MYHTFTKYPTKSTFNSFQIVSIDRKLILITPLMLAILIIIKCFMSIIQLSKKTSRFNKCRI